LYWRHSAWRVRDGEGQAFSAIGDLSSVTADSIPNSLSSPFLLFRNVWPTRAFAIRRFPRILRDRVNYASRIGSKLAEYAAADYDA
jgi:hypothetical protein